MELTKEEERILKGEYGDTARKLMEISIKVGEVNGAERMVDIVGAQVGAAIDYIEGYGGFGTVGIELLEALAESGLRFKVRTTAIPLSMDLCAWKSMGLPEEFAETQMRSVIALRKLGAVPDYSCLPYMEGSALKMGDHIAWVESGDIAIANSYIGARTNREVDLTALAAAICGRTPEYGYHLKENRYGETLIKVDTALDYADLGALGFYVGKIGVSAPVFDGIPRKIGIEEIQQLMGPVNMQVTFDLIHIVGVTPEAPTLEAAFGGRKPKETIIVGRKELAETYEALNTAKSGEVDFVCIGCHFCTIEKIRKIARLLEGKKIHEGVALWVQTSRTIRNLAERDGDIQTIEKAGGRVLCDSCMFVTPIKKYYGFKVLATDSAKNAFMAQGTPWIGTEVLYGSTERCIEAAVKGRW